MKAHLYKQILSSLRLIRSENNIDIQLHEQLDYAGILYNKGLYLQSLKVLDRIKENAPGISTSLVMLQEPCFLKRKLKPCILPGVCRTGPTDWLQNAGSK